MGHPQLINDQYVVVLEKIDIAKSTMKMLEEAFDETYAVSGDTKQKAVTFFLKAAKFAGLPLSPYLLSQIRNAPKKTRRTRQRAEEGYSEAGLTQIPQAPGLSSHTVELVGGGRITITISANPFTMPAEDRTFFFSLVDMFQRYREQNPTKKRRSAAEEET